MQPIRRAKRITSTEVRGCTVRVSKAPASLASEASVRTRGLPGLHTPATQGSQCERLSTQETAGLVPQWAHSDPQLPGKYLCFLPPSQLAKQAAALSCGKGAEAGGSVVKALPQRPTPELCLSLRPRKLTYLLCRGVWVGEHPLPCGWWGSPARFAMFTSWWDINILWVGSITGLPESLKLYCPALDSCSRPLQPTGVVAPSCGGCASPPTALQLPLV